MFGAWTAALPLTLLMARLPCLPVELDQIPPAHAPDAVALPPPPPPPPAPAPPRVILPLPPFPPLPVPVAMLENARYRIGFGILGQVGEIRTTIEEDHTEGALRLIKIGGYGEGAIFGMGRLRTWVDGQFDTAVLGSRRWTAARWKDDQTITDIIDQPRPGTVNIERRRDGRAPEHQAALLPLPTFDPLGFMLRVRIAPPAPGQTQVLQVMEGRALWRATLTTAGTQPLPDASTGISALRIDGRLDPIFYDGQPDDAERPHRTFTLWLSADAARVPLRLSVPVGIGDVVVELVEVQRQIRH
jgi:Protein of unknown function (DUF3108)